MFDTAVIKSLKVGLQANNLRQKTIASNVANINTPGYKTKDVSFQTIYDGTQEETALALKRTHPNHMRKMQAGSLNEDYLFLAYKPKNPKDGINDVDIDREMVKNSETFMNINMYSKLLKGKYTEIRDVIDASAT